MACSFYDEFRFAEPAAYHLQRRIGADGACRAHCELFSMWKPCGSFGSHLTAVFGGNKAFGVLMAATVGVPLYACGGGTIPLLQGWLLDGMSLGSAAAFMVTGPATKITNLGAVKIVLGVRRFVLYLAYVMAFSFIAGLAVNHILFF